MKWRNIITPSARFTWTCAALTLIACGSPVAAEPVPPKNCAAIAKQEYTAAKKQRLLHGRFGSYVRTGRLGQRQYWYCHS